jgi:arylsulfatase A-like enzyme
MPLLVAGLALLSSACERFEGPLHLLKRTASGDAPRTASITTGGETRPALVSSARYDVPVPRRGLLTLGMGVLNTTGGQAPGWYHLSVRSGETVLAERKINPRELHGWRDVSVPLEGLGRRASLRFDMRLTEKDGTALEPPAGLVLAVSDPVIHDLDDYGKAKGIVLISIDTLRRDHVGAYGYSKPTTPRLDALAAGGILCDDAVSTSSWTLPAHLSMLTSTDPGVHGGTNSKVGFNRTVPTLASLFHEAGYATQAVTSHLYVSRSYGVDTGFDHLEFNQKFRANNIVDRGIDLIDRFGDRPFLVFLHFYDPHWHYDPHDGTTRLFDAGYKGKQGGRLDDFKELDPAKVPPEDLAHLLALYDGEIRYTDDEIGRFLDHLKARGLDKSTLVVVTSDHGEEFGEHGSWEHQKTLYEEVLRIPLIVNGPGIAPRREAAPVSLLDVAPTIVVWSRLSPKWDPQGLSLIAPLAERRPAYGETDHTVDGTRKMFLRLGAKQSKVIFSVKPKDGTIAREEWYELGGDPRETKNVRPREDVVNAVRQQAIGRWVAGRRGVTGPTVKLTDEEREQLFALGYPR